ncbi:DUF1488 family protein [Mesorhizobium sp. PUT5]|uniref:DUF1488 family protein n=1 Tax=Mesorhizobium sp. PUT5 TaxID=3454629 RepID=UPI003FA43FA9
MRFSGYDGMFQVPFLIEAPALASLQGNSAETLASEAECLVAFDAMRGVIHGIARTIYANGRSPIYTLTVKDCR